MITVKVSKCQKTTVVLDTNIIVSSIIFGGKPRDVFLLVVQREIRAYCSPFLLFEVIDLLRSKFSFNEKQLKIVNKIIKNHFIKVFPKVVPRFSDDLSDNKILAIALESKANYLITGDKKHLLPLKKVKNTKIVTADNFLNILKNSR